MIYSGSSRSSSNLLQPYYTPARSQSSQGYSSDYRFPLPDQQQEVLPTTLMSSLNNLVNEISERLDNTTLLECKREKRSCSISSFLLNPNSLASTNTSPTPSPSYGMRNQSLPGNKLFFFPVLSANSSRRASDCSGQSSVGSTFFSPGHGLSPAPSPCSTPRPTRSSLSSPCGPKGRQRRVRSIAGSERKLSDQNTDTDDILYSLGFNPKLYQKNPEEQEEKFPENHLGRIFYNLSYEVDKETLSVRIINIKNLPNNPKEFGKIYKSYLAVCLLPDERSERKVYQAVDNFSDLNPVFNETFNFQVSAQNIADRVIKMKVMNIDVNKKHRVIGQVLCSLTDMDFININKFEMASDIAKYTRGSVGGGTPELLLSIGFNPTISRLTVNILQGKNFRKKSKENHENLEPNTYAKILLGNHTKVVKAKKTVVVKNCSSPEFSESFHFKVEEKDFDTTSITVNIMEEMSLFERDRTIGSCVIGGFMFARGKGEGHWVEVKKNIKQQIEMWHTLLEKSKKKDQCSGGFTPRIEPDSQSSYF